MTTLADFIVVGGGSGGCVVAARLAEKGHTVTLLEAGPIDRNPMIHLPVGFFGITEGPLTWGLATASQAGLDRRSIPYPQARVLGGGGSINAQVYTRGHKRDFDDWASVHGCTGWAFQDVLPIFVGMEGNTALAGPLHGSTGPLGVSELINPHPLTRAFVQSCQEIGIPATRDFNGEEQAGAAVYQTTTVNARRCSAVTAFLKPALKTGRINLITGAMAEQIVVCDGRAMGVRYRRGTTLFECRARREVILAAGAIHTPKLMLLSGIGPALQLRDLGIEVKVDAPAVGANLQDHFDVDILYRLKANIGLNRYENPIRKFWAGLQYLLFRTGPVTSNIAEGGAFWYVGEGREQPDIQFHFLPAGGAEAGVDPVPGGAGCTLNWYWLRPKSRGTVMLASAQAQDHPRIDPAFLTDPVDIEMSIAGFDLARKIMRSFPLARHCVGEHHPGDAVSKRDEKLAYIRQFGRTAYHPVGTCRMGPDPGSVVDLQLRVRGLDNLRIADASVMPSIVSSNTNATTMMIADRAASMIDRFSRSP